MRSIAQVVLVALAAFALFAQALAGTCTQTNSITTSSYYPNYSAMKMTITQSSVELIGYSYLLHTIKKSTGVVTQYEPKIRTPEYPVMFAAAPNGDMCWIYSDYRTFCRYVAQSVYFELPEATAVETPYWISMYGITNGGIAIGTLEGTTFRYTNNSWTTIPTSNPAYHQVMAVDGSIAGLDDSGNLIDYNTVTQKFDLAITGPFSDVQSGLNKLDMVISKGTALYKRTATTTMSAVASTTLFGGAILNGEIRGYSGGLIYSCTL